VTDRAQTTILTGFLGSGKTTLLNRWLSSPSLQQTAVIVNELGEIGVDHALIAESTETTLLLDSGCLCCAMLGTFRDTLIDLVHRRARGEVPRFANVVVETTGLADPAPVLQTLLRDRLVAPFFELAEVVTTVDPCSAPATLELYVEARRQVAFADRVLITKTDVAPDRQVESTLAAVRALQPAALCEPARGSTPRPGRGWTSSADASAQGAAAHTQDIQACSREIEGPIEWQQLADWTRHTRELFGRRLLRAKGIFEVAGEDRPVLVQGVQGVFAPPEYLATWPFVDARSRVTCVAHGIPRAELGASLELLNPGRGLPPSADPSASAATA